VKALAERRFEGECFAAVLIDGVEYAGEVIVVALGITEDGTKRILGLRQGATENAAVCAALLEDLDGRGLDPGRPGPIRPGRVEGAALGRGTGVGPERGHPTVSGP
jgi:hypothetical protein